MHRVRERKEKWSKCVPGWWKHPADFSCAFLTSSSYHLCPVWDLGIPHAAFSCWSEKKGIILKFILTCIVKVPWWERHPLPSSPQPANHSDLRRQGEKTLAEKPGVATDSCFTLDLIASYRTQEQLPPRLPHNSPTTPPLACAHTALTMHCCSASENTYTTVQLCAKEQHPCLAWWRLFFKLWTILDVATHGPLTCHRDLLISISVNCTSCIRRFFTEAADFAGWTCSFTPWMQSVFISKVRTRAVINPNLLQWIEITHDSICVLSLHEVRDHPVHEANREQYAAITLVNCTGLWGSTTLWSSSDCLV